MALDISVTTLALRSTWATRSLAPCLWTSTEFLFQVLTYAVSLETLRTNFAQDGMSYQPFSHSHATIITMVPAIKVLGLSQGSTLVWSGRRCKTSLVWFVTTRLSWHKCIEMEECSINHCFSSSQTMLVHMKIYSLTSCLVPRWSSLFKAQMSRRTWQTSSSQRVYGATSTIKLEWVDAMTSTKAPLFLSLQTLETSSFQLEEVMLCLCRILHICAKRCSWIPQKTWQITLLTSILCQVAP